MSTVGQIAGADSSGASQIKDVDYELMFEIDVELSHEETAAAQQSEDTSAVQQLDLSAEDNILSNVSDDDDERENHSKYLITTSKPKPIYNCIKSRTKEVCEKIDSKFDDNLSTSNSICKQRTFSPVKKKFQGARIIELISQLSVMGMNKKVEQYFFMFEEKYPSDFSFFEAEGKVTVYKEIIENFLYNTNPNIFFDRFNVLKEKEISSIQLLFEFYRAIKLDINNQNYVRAQLLISKKDEIMDILPPESSAIPSSPLSKNVAQWIAKINLYKAFSLQRVRESLTSHTTTTSSLLLDPLKKV